MNNVQKLEIIDSFINKKITINLDTPCELFYFSLETLSQSEKGFDLTKQAVSFAMAIPFTKELKLKGSLEVDDV
jgi:hypothetical protein